MKEEAKNHLWIKFKEGDNHALSCLYSEFAHELYSYGWAIVKDEQLIKDCIQEVFIHLIDKRKKLVVTSRIHLYLFKSLRNKILEELRTKNKKQHIEKLLAEEDAYEHHAERQMIDSEELKTISQKISSVLAKLPSRQREIIYLRYTEGLNYDEISELLQIDKASARTLLYRSLKTIKEQLGSNMIFLLSFICTSWQSKCLYEVKLKKY